MTTGQVTHSAILLAGGKSRRMGQEKIRLPFGRRSLAARVYEVVAAVFDSVVVVTNQPEAFPFAGARLIGDRFAGRGPLEGLASGLWPDSRHAVIAMPDGKKGERLVLVTDRSDADSAALIAHAKAQGAPELAVPRRIVKTFELPVLGSGKTDYVAIQRIAEAEAG